MPDAATQGSPAPSDAPTPTDQTHPPRIISMSDKSDAQSAVDVLRADNERLNGLVNKLSASNQKLKADHDSVTKERDTFKTAAAEGDKHKVRVDELSGELRGHKHKSAFSKAAKAAGVHEDDLDDFYQISGYKAEKDDVDAKAITGIIDGLKETKPRWFTSQQDDQSTTQLADKQSQTTSREQERVIPNQGRGTYAGNKGAGKGLSREQMADPKFMLNPNNKAYIAEAIAARRAS